MRTVSTIKGKPHAQSALQFAGSSTTNVKTACKILILTSGSRSPGSEDELYRNGYEELCCTYKTGAARTGTTPSILSALLVRGFLATPRSETERETDWMSLDMGGKIAAAIEMGIRDDDIGEISALVSAVLS